MELDERLADSVAATALKDPEIRKTVQDSKLFDGFNEHPGLRRLIQILEDDEEAFLYGLARRMLKSNTPVDQREIDFHRAFYLGARWILKHPEQAEVKLEHVARLAYGLFQEEAIAEEGETPYA